MAYAKLIYLASDYGFVDGEDYDCFLLPNSCFNIPIFLNSYYLSIDDKGTGSSNLSSSNVIS